ncbi:MAG: hypothetical protein DRH10_05880, partial [Deltaproteobacteria bacterium]
MCINSVKAQNLKKGNTFALLKKQTYGADSPSDWRLAHCLRALLSVEKKQYPGYSPLTITDIVSEWMLFEL